MTPPARDGGRAVVGTPRHRPRRCRRALHARRSRARAAAQPVGVDAAGVRGDPDVPGLEGRFPRGLFELPDDAIEHLARQVKVAAARIGAYDFTGRQIKNHRRETAIRVGTASTEAILRRFTRDASHTLYQAMLELGSAQKTIFLCRYLCDRDLQREINSGLNVVEDSHDVNDVILFGGTRRSFPP